MNSRKKYKSFTHQNASLSARTCPLLHPEASWHKTSSQVHAKLSRVISCGVRKKVVFLPCLGPYTPAKGHCCLVTSRGLLNQSLKKKSYHLLQIKGGQHEIGTNLNKGLYILIPHSLCYLSLSSSIGLTCDRQHTADRLGWRKKQNGLSLQDSY